ncbi:MAG: TonB-dependent receptor [Bacteroidaceae bacterium]|nr:TonB-dependent receptor [Bacteroidaceae bacterium]
MKKALFLFLVFVIAAASARAQRVTVCGHITDSLSRETLIGATARVLGSLDGTTSNSFGFYSLTLPAGEVVLSYSYSGYQPTELRLSLKRDTVINVSLRAKDLMREVVVEADRTDAGLYATGMGITDVSVSQIEHTPSLLGETDVIRTLQLLPGVQSGMNGMAGLYVRGGAGDENLIMLDGVPIYKVDHLFGFFSVFTPEAMKKVTFYKSSFPARYNGRLSSIVDVRTRDGDMQNYHGTASIGLLSSRLNFEGPIIKDRTSFSLSARTSYWSWVARPFMPKDSKFGYTFYDLNAKLNHRFSDRDRLYLSFYQGQDRLKSDYEDHWGDYGEYTERYGDRMHWGNTLASLRWNHIFTDQLFANATVSTNNYKMRLKSYDNLAEPSGAADNASSKYNSSIHDLTAQIDFDYDPRPQHRIQFGAAYTRHNFRPETSSNQLIQSSAGKVLIDTAYIMPARKIPADEAMVYAEDNWRVTRALHLTPGLAYTLFHVDGTTYSALQPRLSLRWQAAEAWALKAAYSEMAQYIHLLTSMPIAMPTDLWVPITRNIKPERASQFSLGAYFTGLKGWEMSVEGYYKNLRNVLEYRDGMSFFGFSGSWENLVAVGTGRAAGLEFLLRKTSGRTTGWLAYTLAKSTRKFSRDSGVNDGHRFPFTFDRRHTLNLVVNHKFSQRLDLDGTWMFHSGEAATLATQKGIVMNPDDGSLKEVYYVPSRGNYRLPCSHTLSLGLNIRKQLKCKAERTWNISLYNAYNAMNPTLVYRKEDNVGNYRHDKLTKYTLLPCIPSFTLTYKW